MSGWFDRLLEELQRRQEAEDARREGRPFERSRERNVTPVDESRRGGRRGGNGHDRGGGPPVVRPVFGGDTPWRRYRLSTNRQVIR